LDEPPAFAEFCKGRGFIQLVVIEGRLEIEIAPVGVLDRWYLHYPHE
jgi:hypothetical protein